MITTVLETVTAPAAQPITTAEAKEHLRVTHADDDTYIDALILMAVEVYQAKTSRRLVTQTLDWHLDGFDAFLDRDPTGRTLFPPASPLQSVTSVQYVDCDGVTQTLDSARYRTSAVGLQPRIQLDPDYSWPDVRAVDAAVTVRMVVGHGGAGDVPAMPKHAIKLLVAHFYENREPVIVGTSVTPVPDTVERLISLDRLPVM